MEIRVSPSIMLRARGFTLIEVVVVVGVMALIASATLFNFPQFSRRIQIEQEAGKLALSVRKAQAYSIAVREFSAGSGVFPGYGVYVSTANPNGYVIFGDPNKTSRYDASLGESVETVNFASRVKIAQICGNSQLVPPGPCTLSSADIFYIRPGPDSTFTGVDSGLPSIYSDIKIILSSEDAALSKSVVIWPTGQVSIQ